MDGISYSHQIFEEKFAIYTHLHIIYGGGTGFCGFQLAVLVSRVDTEKQYFLQNSDPSLAFISFITCAT